MAQSPGGRGLLEPSRPGLGLGLWGRRQMDAFESHKGAVRRTKGCTGRVKATHDDNALGANITEHLASASYRSKCFYMRQFNAFIKPSRVAAVITPILKMGK